jgi:hypothetical protein
MLLAEVSVSEAALEQQPDLLALILPYVPDERSVRKALLVVRVSMLGRYQCGAGLNGSVPRCILSSSGAVIALMESSSRPGPDGSCGASTTAEAASP